ncbi:MAG: HNH endonuclease domain-containing protein [Rhodospirillales bacterium]
MSDPQFHDLRQQMLIPIKELYEAARLLHGAADDHCANRHEEAIVKIKKADIPELYDWCEELWGPRGSVDAFKRSPVHRYRDVEGAPPKIKGRKFKYNIPQALKNTVLARDGYFCQFCGIPVILQQAQSVLRKFYGSEIRWGNRNAEKHTAFQALDLDFDHILPLSRGGDNSVENLIVACAPCNCGRGNWTLEEVGVLDPRNHPRQPRSEFKEWDGLTRVLKHRRQ